MMMMMGGERRIFDKVEKKERVEGAWYISQLVK